MKINLNRKLYLGCGGDRIDGFIHADIDFHKNFKKKNIKQFDIICDISKKIPIPDNSFDFIYSRHTLEHLTYRELINHLIEAHRILSFQGIYRICVPDLDKQIEAYQRKSYSEKDFQTWKSPDWPDEDHTELFIKRIMYFDHYYLHNFHTLSKALRKVGYDSVNLIDEKKQYFDDTEIEERIKSRENFKLDLVVHAQKIRRNVLIEKFKIKDNANFINKFLGKFFNLKITKYNTRRSSFPSKVYFKEIGFKILKKINLLR